MAGRQELNPYRELQVDPGACPEVIAAAFAVLREMTLRSDADDAPRRLARLNAAHRTLADPVLRAAHDAAGWHLAQVNVALPLAPLDAPLLADFVAALDPVNAVADASPGFVWRLQDGDVAVPAVQLFGDERVLVNLSVWRSLEDLRAFTYGEDHAAVLRRRRDWFARLGAPETALWWIRAGTLPTVPEAEERLALLRGRGPTSRAFTLLEAFPPPAAQARRAVARDGVARPQHDFQAHPDASH